MSSDVEICNLALSHLGSYSITSLGDKTQEGRRCNQHFKPARDFCLRTFPWNFAEKRLALAVLATESSTGYEYAYAYPTDCLHARLLYVAIAGVKPLDFIITSLDDLSGRKILSNEGSAILIYTAKVTSAAVFDSAFIIALSYQLASALAIPLTKDKKLHQSMLQGYVQYMSMAQTAGAREAHDSAEVTNPFMAARL